MLPYIYEPKKPNPLQFFMKKYRIEIKGLPVAWYKTGEGKPLIMLHGWGSSSAVMQSLANRLAQFRSVYLLDFPGFGNSPEPPQPWTIQHYANIVEEWINRTAPEGDFDLLAHSFGGRVAIKLLSNQPISSRIDKVIFTGAAGLKPKRPGTYYIKKYTAKLLKAPFYILPLSMREKGLAQLRQTKIWKQLGSADYKKLSGVMRETFVKTVTEFQDDELKKINHEILLVWGEDDSATPLEQGIRMDKILPDSALVTIKHAGHYAFLDQPAQFTAIAKAYLGAD